MLETRATRMEDYLATHQQDNTIINRWWKALARASHETINGRLKKWRILSEKYWHPLELHRLVFFGITNITQLSIEEDSPTFQVDCCM